MTSSAATPESIATSERGGVRCGGDAQVPDIRAAGGPDLIVAVDMNVARVAQVLDRDGGVEVGGITCRHNRRSRLIPDLGVPRACSYRRDGPRRLRPVHVVDDVE